MVNSTGIQGGRVFGVFTPYPLYLLMMSDKSTGMKWVITKSGVFGRASADTCSKLGIYIETILELSSLKRPQNQIWLSWEIEWNRPRTRWQPLYLHSPPTRLLPMPFTVPYSRLIQSTQHFSYPPLRLVPFRSMATLWVAWRTFAVDPTRKSRN
jgi:hypothetical protein